MLHDLIAATRLALTVALSEGGMSCQRVLCEPASLSRNIDTCRDLASRIYRVRLVVAGVIIERVLRDA